MKKLIPFFLFPVFVCAEPGPVTQYLMNEPVSLFDVGMMRLARLTSWAESHVGYAWTLRGKLKPVAKGISAEYSPEDDKIYVYISVMDETATEAQMQEGCKEALHQLQIVVSKSLPGLFQHAGRSDPSEPTALSHTLFEMFELRCYVSGHDSSVGRFWASQSLKYSQEMTIGKWKMKN